MQPFDAKIHETVNLFAHPVWFIVRDESLDCPCLDFTSKVPNPHCKKCLGTGKKIKLVKVKAAHQHNKISFRGEGVGFSEMDVVSVYYTNQATEIKEGDYVIDHESVDIVKNVYYERSDSHKVVYWRIETAPAKSHSTLIKELLSQILKEAGVEQ